MEPWGDVCLSQDHSSAHSPFFGHGSSLESMCLHCNERTEAFLQTARAQKSLRQRGLDAKFYEERGRVACLLLILLGLVNYIVKAPHTPHTPSRTSKYRRAPGWGFDSVMLPSAGIGGSDMQT